MQILYQDEFLLAVAKPAGMIVHRGWGQDAIAVADLVRDEIIGKPVHAVHRLDRGTSGVLLFALNANTARNLQIEMENNRIKKQYLALVRGPMLEACSLEHPVPKDKSKDSPRVHAATRFEPLAHQARWSLILAEPTTGRLHQIRRHLKHLSHPIVGDVRYGKGEINRFFRNAYGLDRLALHAFRIELQHKQFNPLIIEAEIPEDLMQPFSRMGIQVPPYLPVRSSTT